MNKNKMTMVEYANYRIRLDSIVDFWPIAKSESSGENFGVHISKRDGSVLDMYGDDRTSRNELIAFLDNHFNVKTFNANKCPICANKAENCSSNYSCRKYTNWPKFERRKESSNVNKTA